MYVFYVAPSLLSYSAIERYSSQLPFLFFELDSVNVIKYLPVTFSTFLTRHVFQFACLPLSKDAVVKKYIRVCNVVAWLQRRYWSGGDSWWCRSNHYHDSHGSYCTSNLRWPYFPVWSRRVRGQPKWLCSIFQRRTLGTSTESESPANTWLQLLHLSDGVQAVQQT